IPIQELWKYLSFTRAIPLGTVGWAQTAKLRQTLFPINNDDGETITRALQTQESTRREFELDTGSRRHIRQRTVVRTEKGEIEVEVPSREDEEEVSDRTDASAEVRPSLIMQARIAELGSSLGLKIWLPPNDRARVLELVPSTHHGNLLSTLP